MEVQSGNLILILVVCGGYLSQNLVVQKSVWRGFLSGNLLCKIDGCSLDGDLSMELIVSKMVPSSKDHAR